MKLSYAMRRIPIFRHSGSPVGITLRLAAGRREEDTRAMMSAPAWAAQAIGVRD
jgi:hypothetical protein